MLAMILFSCTVRCRGKPHSFPRKKASRLESALLGSAFGRFQSSGWECLQALCGVWLQALFPLSMAYGISHFHAVRRGVEAAQALLPCLDSWALQVCSDLERSRACCHSSWL